MKLGPTGEQRLLREEVRGWLRQHRPAESDIPRDLEDRMAFLRTWQRRCYEQGYVGRSWPAEFGGEGRPSVEQIIIDQELAREGAPEFIGVIGLDVIGPSLLRFGDSGQRTRYARPILSAEEIWCQGFSEPDAGSDLASLRTSALERDGHFVVNGQKTWTSWAQFARWCGLLVRTDPSAPPHHGLSLLIVDMEAPGIEVRPMTQITGHAEFCEVFFDDVMVPSSNLLGRAGQGWQIAMHTLAHERGTAALPRQVKLRTWLDRLVAETRRRTKFGEPLVDHPSVQLALGQALIQVEVLRYHAYRMVGAMLDGDSLGPDSSTVKLLMAEAEQTLASTALEVLGPTLYATDGDNERENQNAFWEETYLYSRAATVYGGTQQIQRNIIADRVLELPRG